MAGSVQLSREFLEEIFREIRPMVPGWMYATLRRQAMSRAGGRASHRRDGPTTIEKLALSEIRPANLSRLSDTELEQVWSRLNQWFTTFRRRKQPVEDAVASHLEGAVAGPALARWRRQSPANAWKRRCWSKPMCP